LDEEPPLAMMIEGGIEEGTTVEDERSGVKAVRKEEETSKAGT
jgi:hypothetical protein